MNEFEFRGGWSRQSEITKVIELIDKKVVCNQTLTMPIITKTSVLLFK